MTDNTITIGCSGEIITRVYEQDEIEREFGDEWNHLSDEQRLEKLTAIEPTEEQITTNVTTDVLHQYFVDELDETQTPTTDITASYLGLGRDDSVSPTESSTALNDEITRVGVTTVTDNQTSILTETFVGSSTANGETIVELGLFNDVSGSDMLNHTLITPVVKDSSKTLTFNVILQFSTV